VAVLLEKMFSWTSFIVPATETMKSPIMHVFYKKAFCVGIGKEL
jgi:hypothetical protein